MLKNSKYHLERKKTSKLINQQWQSYKFHQSFGHQVRACHVKGMRVIMEVILLNKPISYHSCKSDN